MQKSEQRRVAFIVGCLLLVTLVLAVAPAALAYDQEELQFLTLINNHRTQNRLPPLTMSGRLTIAAMGHSEDMGLNGYHSHDSLDGRDAKDRILATGYGSYPFGENIGVSTDGSAQVIFDAWRNSPTHNTNMLMNSFRAIGIDRFYSNRCTPLRQPDGYIPPTCWYWTTDFGGANDGYTLPTMTIPAPTGSSLVSGIVEFKADVSDASGVNAVKFYIDDVLVFTDTSWPYVWHWNTNGYSASKHTLKTSLEHFSGYVTDDAMEVTVDNFTPASNIYFAWYDQVSAGMKNWVLMAAAPGNSGSARSAVKVGQLTYADRIIPGTGPAETMSFPGVMGGPVTVATTDDLFVSQRSLWMNNSLEEVVGIDEDRLSSHYYWTWYDQLSYGYKNWVVVTNPSRTETVRAEILIKGQKMVNRIDPTRADYGTNYFDIGWGGNVTPQFPGEMGGPVEVKAFVPGGSWDNEGDRRNVIASQRVLSNNGTALNEAQGIPAGELSHHYLWTWYDDSAGKDWILLANTEAEAVSYRVDVGDGCNDNGAWSGIPGTACYQDAMPAKGTPGAIATFRLSERGFPGLLNGPVEVTAWKTADSSPAKIVASQRVVFGPSFGETMGYRAEALASTYHWTWYDQYSAGMKNWVLVSLKPGETDTVTVKVSFTDMGSGQPVTSTYDINPASEQRYYWNFPGKMGGPVQAKAYKQGEPSTPKDVIASQRVLYNGYFNEVVGSVLQ